jgi:hypothetical protein
LILGAGFFGMDWLADVSHSLSGAVLLLFWIHMGIVGLWACGLVLDLFYAINEIS